ncbi:MAG: DUF4382 domain-containing protein [Lutibacter sp.]|nr:DUF4382 domain-containing protein [Lutibacter sp.]
MKIKSIILAVFSFFILVLLVQSCENNERIELNDNTTSRIQLKLVDAPDDNYLEVWVEIIDVQYNRNDDNSGWLSFDGYPKETGDMVDLTSLIAGSSHILTDQEIESGMLSKIRLVLGDNNYLVIEGVDENVYLKTPSAQQSGLKLNLNTEIIAGYSYDFTLDWDVQKSIVKAGNSGNYNLKPVIHVMAEANSGTIFGRIADIDETGSEPMPLEALITLYDPLDTEFENPGQNTTSNDEGLFMLQGVPGGDYVLRVTHDDYDDETKHVTAVNEQNTEANFLLTKSTGSLSGRVADSTESEGDLKPLGGVVVNAYAVGDTLFETILGTDTTSSVDGDTLGTFNIPGLLPGEYVLKATLDTYDEGQSGTVEALINQDVDAGTILLTLTGG